MMDKMNQEQLLHYIDVVSFQVIEMQLFLDSHTDNQEAMQQFCHYSNLRNDAMKLYAKKYGPLTIDTAQPSDRWLWAEQPWPWEGGKC